MTRYHVFLSYARVDNGPNADGWVTAFHDRLVAQHLTQSGRPLRPFFDKLEIADGQDWEHRIGTGLRNSQLFIAFISPNYLDSEWCRREWERYLQLEHTLARGDDGLKQIYFVTVPELHDRSSDAATLKADLADWVADLRRRNRTQSFDLRDWFADGPQALAILDAEDRLAELRANPRSDQDRKLISLADRIAEIDRSIAARLDRAALAELATENGNIGRSYPHFVGRHRELTRLHAQLTSSRKIGVISALHGLGGQGKTALAEQYAYAYAEHYAAGGRWKLACEGRSNLAAALEPLLREVGLQIEIPSYAEPELRIRLMLTRIGRLVAFRTVGWAEVQDGNGRLGRQPHRVLGALQGAQIDEGGRARHDQEVGRIGNRKAVLGRIGRGVDDQPIGTVATRFFREAGQRIGKHRGRVGQGGCVLAGQIPAVGGLLRIGVGNHDA